MKIALVSPYDWSYPGGVRDHLLHLADQLTRMGQDVRILTPASGPKSRLAEVHIYKMGGTIPFPINGSTAHLAFQPAVGKRVHSILERERFDVIHVHEPLLPSLPLAILHASRTVTVGTFHAFAHTSMTSPPYLLYASAAPFLRPYFQRLHGRIAVSTAARQFVSQFFHADYRVIPNGIDLERFNSYVAPLPHLMDGKQNILFVGRFEKRKGATYLVHAIPYIRERYPNTRFLFVGDGALKDGLQQFVVQHGWHDVAFTGYVSDEDLPRYFTSAHVFCAPATGGESMGIVLLEAMASGAPIVATNIEGYSTVVTPGADGLLVTPQSSQELAKAVGHLLEHEPLRQQLIHAGLQKVRDYAWPSVALHIMEYYYESLNEQQTTSRILSRAG